ncbi:MAG: hypothetical protein ACK5Z2_17935 [Bacteroidota bacterium]|jgi:hypothetical protein
MKQLLRLRFAVNAVYHRKRAELRFCNQLCRSMFAVLIKQTAMKTIFALLLILICTETVAQTTVPMNNVALRIKMRLGNNGNSVLCNQSNERNQFDFPKSVQKQIKTRRTLNLGLQKQNRSSIAKTLGRIYVKNGAAGLMGGWVNNIQLTFGWRYQPLRILTSEQPVPVHPFMMRVRVRV